MQPRKKRCTVVCSFEARDSGWELIRTVGATGPSQGGFLWLPAECRRNSVYAGNSVQI